MGRTRYGSEHYSAENPDGTDGRASGAVHEGHAGLPQCGFSAQTVAALRATGTDFAHFNIFEDPELREALKQYSNWPTYPQLYFKGELVGGCDIVLEMFRSGELKQILDDSLGAPAEG